MNIILFLSVLFLTLQGEPAALKAFRTRMAAGDVLNATLVILDKAPDAKEAVRYTAEVWLASDGYRLEAAGRTYLVQGLESRVLETAEKRVIISPYDPEDDDFAPARYLSGTLDGFNISEQKASAGPKILIKSKDGSDNFRAIEVQFEKAGFPLRLTARDAWGGTVTIQFTKPMWIRTTDWKQLVLPDQTETIDLTQ